MAAQLWGVGWLNNGVTEHSGRTPSLYHHRVYEHLDNVTQMFVPISPLIWIHSLCVDGAGAGLS